MLTGGTEAIAQLAQELKLGRPFPLPLDARSPVVNLAHSNRFILIDGAGQIRAYYSGDSLDPDEVVGDIRRLVKS